MFSKYPKAKEWKRTFSIYQIQITPQDVMYIHPQICFVHVDRGSFSLCTRGFSAFHEDLNATVLLDNWKLSS